MSMTLGIIDVDRLENHIKNGCITTMLDFETMFCRTITKNIPITTLASTLVFI